MSLTRTLAGRFYPVLEGLRRVHRVGARERALRRFAAVGENLDFDPTACSITYERVRVGSNVYIGPGAYFLGQIRIGDDVLFGPEVHIQDGYHRTDVVGSSIRDSGETEREEIVIGDDVWVAARVSILKGVQIGSGAVIGTGSIVTRDIPPYVVAVGAPCRPIRRRFDDEELRAHLRLRGASEQDADDVVAERARRLEPAGVQRG